MAFKLKKGKFFSSLINISQNIKESADYFANYKLNNVSDFKGLSEVMKEYEHKGDSMVHEVIKDLNNAFITPIEREDILALTISMDDVLDALEHCSALFEMYSLIHMDEYIWKFVDALKNCTYEMDKAIDLLASKKLQAIHEHAVKIKELESLCDGILRQAIKNLFTVEKDPIRIIQYKEIYESLEEAADYCETVANTLEIIIMKNA